MFLHLSVSHSVHRVGVYPSMQWAGVYTPRQTLPRQIPPLGGHPLGRHPPDRHSLPGRHAQGRHPHPRQIHPQDGHWSGQCTSYWNAFLFKLFYWSTQSLSASAPSGPSTIGVSDPPVVRRKTPLRYGYSKFYDTFKFSLDYPTVLVNSVHSCFRLTVVKYYHFHAQTSCLSASE